MNKRNCKTCQYWRNPGPLDTDIEGAGNWCSNSQSPLHRTRPKANMQCSAFSQKGKKAPWWLRLANYALRKFNAWLSALKKRLP